MIHLAAFCVGMFVTALQPNSRPTWIRLLIGAGAAFAIMAYASLKSAA